MPTTSDEVWTGAIRDEPEMLPLIRSQMRYEGPVWSVRSDTVDFHGRPLTRDVIVHPGAAAVVALDSSERVYLLRQYRHPAGMMLFEPPAGLIDKPSEDPLETAKRELAEEAGLSARTWHTLVDYFTTPGGSSEAIRIFLARDVDHVPGGRIRTGEAEEETLPGAWVPLSEAVDLVLAGELANPTAAMGILATSVMRSRSWSGLRPADCAWPSREHLARTQRLFAVEPG